MNPNENQVPQQPQVVVGDGPQPVPAQPQAAPAAQPQAVPQAQPQFAPPAQPQFAAPAQPVAMPTSQPLSGGAPMAPVSVSAGSSFTKLALIVVAALLLVGGGAYGLLGTKKHNAGSNTGNSSAANSSAAAAANTSSGAKTACDVFTSSDAQKLLATTVKQGAVNSIPPINGRNGTISQCDYDSTDTSNPASVSVQLTVGKSSQVASQMFSTLKSAESTPPPAVSGVGDQAYFDGALLLVQKNNVVVMASVLSASTSANKQALDTQVANTVLSRL